MSDAGSQVKITSHQHTVEKVIMKTIFCLVAVFELLLLNPNSAYTRSPLEARRELSQLNIPYGVAFFFNQIQEGDNLAVQLFLQAGMDVNAQDKEGSTALMHAVAGHHMDIVKILLANGVDVNAKDAVGGTALMRAAIKGHTDILRVLLAAGANGNLQNESGETALTVAALESNASIVQSASGERA
jgi:ankyrin repeat protein